MCGVNDSDVFYGKFLGKRIYGDILSDTFEMFMGNPFEELYQDFKSYYNLTQYQVRIRLIRGDRNIFAFIHCV